MLMPALLALIFGLVEFSWYMMEEMSVARAAQSGARQGSTTPTSSAAIAVARQTIMDDLAAGGLDPTTATLTVSIDAVSGGKLLTVDTLVPYGGLTGLVPIPLRLRASASAMYEGDL